MEKQIVIDDEQAMMAFAAKLAATVEPATVIYLSGELGAGKTVFCRGFIQSLGYKDRVKSPTYGLLETYSIAGLEIIHMDLYRIADPGELAYLGIDDQRYQQAVWLIEWASHGRGDLPPADLTITIDINHHGRQILAVSQSTLGERLLINL